MSKDIDILTKEFIEHFSEAVNNEVNPVVYLSIDPGKSNGICGYDEKAYLKFMMNVDIKEVFRFLDLFKKVKICVIEDFLLYPDKMKKQVYSSMETSRVIGRVEYWAEQQKIELIKQGARVKKTGYAWAGEKPLPKSNPKNHQMDAHVHFVYWAIRHKIMRPEDLPKLSKPDVI